MFYEFFSEKNTPYFVVVLGLIVIVLLIGLFIKEILFERKITTKTIDIVSRIETDAVTEEECVKMTIANTGFHSTEIRGFGFKHKTRDFDYLRTYKDERNIPSGQKIVISPRDSLETVIDLNDLKAKLNTKKIGKFRAYTIDVYGNYTLIKCKDVKKFIELYFKQIEFIEKVRKMPIEKQQKMLAKENMYNERKKKILNHTIEDTFEKANIDGKEHKEEVTYNSTNYAEEEKIINKEEPINEVVEEKEEINEASEVVEETKEEDSFVFSNFDDDTEENKDEEK